MQEEDFTELTAENVQALYVKAAIPMDDVQKYRKEPASNLQVITRTDRSKVYVRKSVIEYHIDEIRDMLSQLRPEFHHKGDSLIRIAYIDTENEKNHRWAVSPEHVKMLFVLGRAAGIIEVIPEDEKSWYKLPERLPYIRVISGKKEESSG